MSKRKLQPARISIFFYIAAGVVLIGMLVVAQWHLSGISERNDIRSNGQKTTGMAVSRTEVRFPSIDGEITGTPLISPQQGTLTRYVSVVVFYDKDDPKMFILDQDESAYSSTIWIAIAKLGALLILLLGFGYWYQRKSRKVKSIPQQSSTE